MENLQNVTSKNQYTAGRLEQPVQFGKASIFRRYYKSVCQSGYVAPWGSGFILLAFGTNDSGSNPGGATFPTGILKFHFLGSYTPIAVSCANMCPCMAK